MSDRNHYVSKPDKLNNSQQKLLEELWTKYSKKGPKFGHRDFEHIFSSLRNNGLKDSEIESLKSLFRKELELVRKYASKYGQKIMNHVGQANLTDSQVFEYVQEQAAKHKFSRPFTDALFKEMTYRLNQYPTRSSYFRMTPSRNTKLADSLGFMNYENYSAVKMSGNDKTIVDDIMRLHQSNLLTHDSAIKQSLIYEDCSLSAISGAFSFEKHKAEVFVHPVVAALFIPKIRVLDDTMILSSISNIVKARVLNEPIETRPDYELFYNICTDKNEFVCDNRSLWADLKQRALIQVGLWKNILALRTGRYYDELAVLPFMQELQTCNFYKYEAPDLLRSTDEPGSIVRRLLYTFSCKPVIVQTLPILPQVALSANFASTSTYVTPELYNGELDQLPMVNMRLNTVENNQNVSLSDVLNDYEVYFDTSNGYYVPKMTKVIDARGILIIYVHRLNYAIEINKIGAFHFEKLPSVNGQNFRINQTIVATEENMTVGSTEYELRSVVCLKTTRVQDSNGRDIDHITGCEALIRPLLQPNSPFTVSEYLVYDPENVNKFLGDGRTITNNPPVTSAQWNDSEIARRVSSKVATMGVVYVFTPIEEN